MYTLKVYPIATGLPENYFTYFSATEINPGSLVEIQIKNRKLLGLVGAKTELSRDKINIKSQGFPLRKINKLVFSNFLSSELLTSLLKSETLAQIPLSYSLENYLPKFFLEDLTNLNFQAKEKFDRQILKASPSEIILGNANDRISEYTKIISENFKKNKSLVIFAPTILEAEFLQEKLGDFEPILFHSDLKENVLQENLEKLKSVSSALIISTPSLLPFLFLERANLRTVILDQENSSNYISSFKNRPLDFRELVKIISQDLSLKLIFSGNLVSVNNFLGSEIISRPITKAKFQLLDLAKEKSLELTEEERKTRTKKVAENTYKEYSSIYFSRVLASKLDKLKSSEGHAFLFTKRKGLATETVCEDCNQIFKCSDCETPFILYEHGDARYYLCPHCQKKIPLSLKENLKCQNCGSWRLKTLGVGSEGLVKELQKLGFETFLVDAEHTKTRKKIYKVLDEWQASPSGVLVGTELAMNFLRASDHLELTSVISLDSLFAIPDYQMDERIYSLLLSLSEKVHTKNPLLIQTRLGEQELWKFILADEREKFLDSELETRQTLNLPPFTKILKWRLEKRELKLKPEIEKILTKIFQEENLEKETTNYKLEKKSGAYLATLVINKEDWQKKEIEKKDGKLIPSSLAEKVTSLLTEFKLEIN